MSKWLNGFDSSQFEAIRQMFSAIKPEWLDTFKKIAEMQKATFAPLQDIIRASSTSAKKEERRVNESP